jgi:hypothetical protein
MLLLVTGASGVGKSSVRSLVAPRLEAVTCVELRDVVEIPLAPDLAWRQRSVETIVARAAASSGDLLVCGDPIAPGEVWAAPSFSRLDGFACCLLDCGAAAQTARLAGRGDPPSLLPHHIAFADWMREHARSPAHRPEVVQGAGWAGMRWEQWPQTWSCGEIDTSELTVGEAADAVEAWVDETLAAR